MQFASHTPRTASGEVPQAEVRGQKSAASRCALLALGALIVTAGCVSDLDRKQVAVRQEFHSATKAFVVAGGAFADGADEMAAKKHALQKQAIDQVWDAWIAAHTDEFGRLVSRDEASGELAPMPVVQLLAAQKLREEAIVKLHESQKSWQEFRDVWRSALAKFDATNELLAKQELGIAEAKESAAAAFDAALKVLAGAAAGVGIGAGL